MSRIRYLGLTVLVLTLGVTVALTARSGGQTGSFPSNGISSIGGSSSSCVGGSSGVCKDATYVIYSLDELGVDGELGQWVASTLPQVIEPATWGSCTGCSVSYFAPKKILVVQHTPAVQTKVAEFLKKVKKSLPAERACCRHVKMVVKAQPTSRRTERPETPLLEATPSVKELPATPAWRTTGRPKHLFNFSIHYEGEGLIDDNVVSLCKAMYGDAVTKEKYSAASTTPPAPAVSAAEAIPEPKLKSKSSDDEDKPEKKDEKEKSEKKDDKDKPEKKEDKDDSDKKSDSDSSPNPF